MTALRTAEATGHGQVIDLAIIEPIMMMLGGQITAFDQLGIVQPRLGNRSVNNAPRNVYRTGDGQWVAVSTSSQSIAERVMRLVGRPDLIDEPWFATGHSAGRARRRARRRRRLVDRGPARRRGDRRVRGGRGRRRPGVRRARRDGRSAVRGDRDDRHRRRRGARPGQDAERAVPAVRVAGRDPLGRPPARCRHRRGARRARLTPTRSPSCERRASCDDRCVTALYVPGDRPDRFEKAAASGTQLVILDLEDAVAAGRKAAARARGRLARFGGDEATVRRREGQRRRRR